MNKFGRSKSGVGKFFGERKRGGVPVFGGAVGFSDKDF